ERCSRLPAAVRRRRRRVRKRGAGAACLRGRTARRLVRQPLEPQTRLDAARATALVDDVDAVVLSVGACDAEPERRPAPKAELALGCEPAREHERAPEL